MLNFHRHCHGSFPGRGDFLVLRDNDIKTRTPFIHMGSISDLQHHVFNRTGFASQLQFLILSEFLSSHIKVTHILQGSTFTFLLLISTSRHVFHNRDHRGLHLLNFFIQAFPPAIHYRHSIDKYNSAPHLVYFNNLLLGISLRTSLVFSPSHSKTRYQLQH